jgi:hypothetical protein
MVDSKGILSKKRKNLNQYNQDLAINTEENFI